MRHKVGDLSATDLEYIACQLMMLRARDFSSGDLDFNHGGSLSPQQRRRLWRQAALHFLKATLGIAAWTAACVSILVTVRYGGWGDVLSILQKMLVFVAPLAISLYYFEKLSRTLGDLESNSLNPIVVRIRTRQELIKVRGESFPRYMVAAGEMQFEVDEALFNTLSQRGCYALFLTVHTLQVVALEPESDYQLGLTLAGLHVDRSALGPDGELMLPEDEPAKVAERRHK